MTKLFRICQILFSISIIGFGILHLATGTFIAGRAMPLNGIFGLSVAVTGGGLLIATGLLIMIGKNIRLLVLCDAAIIFAWAFLRHLFALAAHPVYDAFLTNTGKSLAMTGALLIIAGTARQPLKGWPPVSFQKKWTTVTGIYFISLFMIICGIQHGLFAEFVSQLVPAWIPVPYFWTYFTGMALIIGGAGMMIREMRVPAAGLSGLMIWLWLVLLHLPRVIAHPGDYNEIASLLETLCFGSVLVLFPAYYWLQKKDKERDIYPVFNS